MDNFITSLHALAEHCTYGALQDDMIRNQIVVGFLEVKLSEKLQLDADLTLTRAVLQARQSEAVKSEENWLRNNLLICHQTAVNTMENRWDTHDKIAQLKTQLVTSVQREVTGEMFGPAHTTLPVHGCFTGTIQQGEKAMKQEIFLSQEPVKPYLVDQP